MVSKTQFVTRIASKSQAVRLSPPPVAPAIFSINNMHIHSRIPPHAINPIPIQHPTVSNSIAAAIQPFGKSIGSL